MSSKRRNPDRVHEVQEGSVIIDICRGGTNDGHHYLYCETIKEYFVGNSRKVRYTTRLSEAQERDEHEAIRKACAWMKRNPQAADPSWEKPNPKAAATNGVSPASQIELQG